MIPKVVHQTAKTTDISWEEKHLIKRNKKLMPDYEFHLWTDEDNQKMVREHFSQLEEKYNSISKGVAKADIARVMYLWGGWYFDTDYKFIKNPDQYVANIKEPIILPKSREKEGDGDIRLGNAIFASEPKQQFWMDFLEYTLNSEELKNLAEN